mmetsp:Transcript_2319/g.3013  ORF Transcript_2319/g.3013 Transcript_2319/m.3013 type:complete len:95 (+) Transcript_2319:437-721(+)
MSSFTSSMEHSPSAQSVALFIIASVSSSVRRINLALELGPATVRVERKFCLVTVETVKALTAAIKARILTNRYMLDYLVYKMLVLENCDSLRCQ